MKIVKRILLALATVALICAAAFLCLIAVLSVTEYRPAEIEDAVAASGTELLKTDGDLTILSWNVGYGALGAEQDFFMDGGSMVRPQNIRFVEQYLSGIAETLAENAADIYLLQEIDERSRRSYYINELQSLSEKLDLPYAFAYNYKCIFVPFPLPPLGKVQGGLATFTNLASSSAKRYALPVPFSWPIRTANLKRCLLVSRIPTDAGNELIIVNLHLEAYDSGEGKIAQTQTLRDFIVSEYEKGNYVIAGGDFNQSFPTMPQDLFPSFEGMWQPGVIESDALPAGWSFANDFSSPTCRSLDAPYTGRSALDKNWQYYSIDGFIVSPNVELKSVRVIDEDFKNSDHNPVVMTVALKS